MDREVKEEGVSFQVSWEIKPCEASPNLIWLRSQLLPLYHFSHDKYGCPQMQKCKFTVRVRHGS